MPESKEAVLYLTSWQKRMVKDFVSAPSGRSFALKDFDKMFVSLGKIHCPASYKVPATGMRKGDWVMYLTDEQMALVKETMGASTPIPAINVSSELLNSGAIAFRR